MTGLFTFKKNYFFLTVAIFILEVLIAVYANDTFVRPYFGDFLVVILAYSFLRSFLGISVGWLALAALLFAYFVELLQYLDLLRKLGLQHSSLAKTVMGSSFEWTDILAYTLGIIAVLWAENLLAERSRRNSAARA